MTDAAAGTSPVKTPSLKSMTGFAQARAENDGRAIRVMVRSVNHRFLDVRVKSPDGFDSAEARVREIVRSRVHRGHLDITLHYEPVGPASVQINSEIAAAYLAAAANLRREFNLTAEPDLASILRLPGVVGAPEQFSQEDEERVARLVETCLLEALDRLDEMRKSEGRILLDEFLSRLNAIRELAGRLDTLAARIRPAYARRFESRLKELLSGTPVEPARLAQEAAIAAEKGDTTEEIARLRSHVQQFESLLKGGGEIGKKLDFLLQEMQREANTLLSKTPGTESEGLEVTGLALEVKSEIEKLREQVQNIE
ncbi:MAG TPA: YicC/YloC family endoribonuclease [Candidatus Acidoferrales bacterium]|nr:YicC/YloC family endoribonuclease [Candidatus Acidoferrales bacterium]